ncbi:MAG: hypothetical protein KC561_19190, partial [Myxococcales bacterium]|nr:hypothetical protein [Myxococcales bacterium]
SNQSEETMSNYMPKGFQAVTPYLLLEDPKGFIAFAEGGLGATERFAAYDDETGRLTHGELELHGCVLELGQPQGEFVATRTNFHVFVEDPDAAHARALEHGAESLYPVTDHPYGERSGGVKDKWGNQWYFAKVIDHNARAT